MATKKQVLTKKQQKQIAKVAKKNPKVFIVGLVAVLVIGGIGVGVYLYMNREKPREPIDSGEVRIHFLELGNKFSGDCILVQCGETDILIDAGSRKNSAPYITDYIDKQITDNKLEYLIVTHAHQDHIAALVGSDNQGIFDHYKIDNIIQFSLTNQDETKGLYKEYLDKRDAEVASGAKLIYAADLFKDKTKKENVFDFGNNLSMTILDQKYYYETDKNDENNYSVCTLFTQGINNYLFTGDLEKSGEESLVKLNDLPKCQLFKAGHHCSYTASNDVLLNKIKPENVVITAVAGDDFYTDKPENQFPAKAALNRILNQTSNIYITSKIDGDECKPMNGNILFKCENGDGYSITGSYNNEKLPKTDWYRENRA